MHEAADWAQVVAGIAAAVAAVIAALALRAEGRRARAESERAREDSQDARDAIDHARRVQRMDILLRLDERFNVHLLPTRRRAARFLLKNFDRGEARRLNSDASEVLNFFEMVAFLTANEEVLDRGLVWSRFGPWVHHYWALCEPAVRRHRLAGSPAAWEDLEDLVSLTTEAENEYRDAHGLPPYEPPTERELLDFLEGEAFVLTGDLQQLFLLTDLAVPRIKHRLRLRKGG